MIAYNGEKKSVKFLMSIKLAFNLKMKFTLRYNQSEM
jgi:hypothetical protein